jgi:hypothetical protein
MKNVLRYLRMAKPFLELAAEELESQDENASGADDRAGAAIRYAADVADALSRKKAVPYPPDALFKKDEIAV